MKKTGFILIFLLSVISTTYAYQNQGFTTYQETDGNVTFQCDNQCFMLIGDSKLGDYLDVQGSIEGNGIIGYGFLQGQQIIPGETIQINQLANISQKFNYKNSAIRSQIPKNSEIQIMLIMQGSLKGQVKANLGESGPIDNLKSGIKSAMAYTPYNPRTINFLEGPIWNGKYINQSFIKLILVLLVLILIGYLFSQKDKDRKKIINIGILVLVFFWVFFDFFSTVNQFKIYKNTINNINIQDNGRLGRESDFYQFLDFIKTQVPNGEKGFFIAPYPFSFEGKYHIYPNVKFDNITGVSYLFFYNLYGPNNGVGFIDPIYSGNILERNNMQFNVEKEIIWKPYAKIYRLLTK